MALYGGGAQCLMKQSVKVELRSKVFHLTTNKVYGSQVEAAAKQSYKQELA